jgi:hypothetical protein
MRVYRWFIISLVLFAVAGWMAYEIFRAERARHLAMERAVTEPFDLEATLFEERGSGEVEVTLFFYNPGVAPGTERFLRPSRRRIYRVDDPSLVARQVLLELFKEARPRVDGEGTEDVAIASPFASARLRQFFLLDDGTAVVDLSLDTVRGFPGGIVSELAFIESVTRSLRENVPRIERVRFLIDGRQAATLGGHVSLNGPFM